MKINIVIIGLGNIGKRHLQAVSRLSYCSEILGYVLNLEDKKVIAEFCQKNNISTENLRLVTNFDDTLKAITERTIVIVSTTAKGRVKIIEQVLKHRPLAIIAEKPLCQNPSEYEHLINLVKEYNIPIYGNFPKHMYPVYQKINHLLKAGSITSFNAITWGGMACAGIHALELMTWLLAVKDYKILKAVCHKEFASKRDGFMDFAADLVLEVNGGIVCSLSASEDKKLEIYDIASEEKKYSVCESSGKILEVNNNAEFLVSDLEILHVSQITDQIVDDIVKGGKVRLPDVYESYTAHKILFECMKLCNLERLNIT